MCGQRYAKSLNIAVREIGFLQAQDGVFLYDKRADDRYLGLGEWALDNALLTLAKINLTFKFTLRFSAEMATWQLRN